MSKAKHTPGPWTAQKGSTLVVAGTVTKNEPWIIQGDVTCVARTDFTDDTEDDHERRVADALLIAAAPDLLAACKEAMFAWAHGVGSVTTSDDPDVRANADRNTREGKRIMRLIADAIAKAEGGAG